MFTTLVAAMVWTVYGLVMMVECLKGTPPSWVHIFIPLCIVILNRWVDYIAEVHK